MPAERPPPDPFPPLPEQGSATALTPPGPVDWGRALLVVVLCSIICELMPLPYFDLADQIMVYLAGVVFVALHYGLAPSLATVALSIFVFDLIFVPPRWGLNPINKQHLFTFAVMLVVGVLISRLAAQARTQAMLAEARARRAATLNQLARQLVVARSHTDVATSVSSAVQAIFARSGTLLLPGDNGQLASHAGLGGAAGEVQWKTAQQAFVQGKNAVGGDALFLPLTGAGAPLGVIMIAKSAHAHRPEDSNLLNAFANLASLAMERLAFERRIADALVDAEGERLRNTLLSGISHDFRTPLTTILGSATVLLEQENQIDASHRVQLARNIFHEAQRMNALVSDVLDLTRMEEGAVRPNHEWCPADELVEAAVRAAGVMAASHELRLHVPPDAVVWCDPRLIEQALVNLLNNALRHTPPGSIVEVSVEEQGDVWHLTVADNGPGLPPGQEQEVFKKFFRSPAALAGTGTGLGLAICAAVARLHQGTITAANNGGARFVLTLPQPAWHVHEEEVL